MSISITPGALRQTGQMLSSAKTLSNWTCAGHPALPSAAHLFTEMADSFATRLTWQPVGPFQICITILALAQRIGSATKSTCCVGDTASVPALERESIFITAILHTWKLTWESLSHTVYIQYTNIRSLTILLCKISSANGRKVNAVWCAGYKLHELSTTGQ